MIAFQIETRKVLRPVVAFGLLILAWQGAASAGLFSTRVFPTPGQCLSGLLEVVRDGRLFSFTVASLFRVTAGWYLAVLLAVPLGLVLGGKAVLQDALNPLLQFLRPISPLAWIPLAILWFGIDEGGKVFVIFIGAFFPILLNTIAGARNIDPVLISAGRILGCKGDASLFRKVVLPASLPQVIVGLRISFGTGWAAIIAAELVAARSGLGYLISNGMEVLRSDFVLVGMVTIGILGVLFDAVFRWVDRRYNWMSE